MLSQVFDEEFFKITVGNVERNVLHGKRGVVVNSMGLEVANIGIRNYQILRFISSFFKLGIDGIKDSIAESGFARILIVSSVSNFLRISLKNFL